MTMAFTVPFVVLILLGCGGVIAWSRYTARREARDLVDSALRIVQREMGNNEASGHLQEAFDEVLDDPRLASVSLLVLDASGRRIAVNRRPTPPWPPRPHDGWLTTRGPIGAWSVVAGIDGRPSEAALRAQSLLLLALAVVVTAAAALLAWLLVGRTLRPIGALSTQAQAATANALSAHLVAPSPDAELRHLVDTLNGMLDRLRADTRARSQFYAAASHELRTPLSVLTGSIEVALSRPRDREEYRETLVELQRQTHRLISLTESLLLLNRLEMGTEREHAEPVDVADICERTLAEFRTPVQERSLRLETDIRDAEVYAAPTTVAVLVRNLVENAVRYSPPHGRVIVTLNATANGPRLDVYNDGALPADLDPERLFEPFYRADASRSAATGGNGLGLTICKALADQNGWLLSLRREGLGVRADVLFGGVAG
jgi:signal transduction histidine kinase